MSGPELPKLLRDWTPPFHLTGDGIKDSKGCWIMSATRNDLAQQLIDVMNFAALSAAPQPAPAVGVKNQIDIDESGTKKVGELIERVRSAGLNEAADVFSNSYWGWLRLTSAYVNAHPYVASPEPPNMTPISALSVTDFTLRHWAPQIPGSPQLDDKAVLEAAASDEEWHRQEDRRMRIDAGEDIL
jgi:hypothetical protein